MNSEALQTWLEQCHNLKHHNVKSRGAIKRLAKDIDQDPAKREKIVEILRLRQIDVDEDWNGKKLLRYFLDRSEEAQIRSNPIHRNEVFDCVFCHQSIPISKGIRDHCPYCLHGLHVDIVPGDRAAQCRAMLIPVAFELLSGIVWIEYACTKCSHQYRVRAHAEDQIPTSLHIADLPKV